MLVVPVIIDLHGHRLEIYTLVSETHHNVDMLLGIKNVYGMEGVYITRESYTLPKCMNPPKTDIILKPKE